MGPFIADSSWVRQAFLVQQQDLEKVDQANRFFTTASLKFTDTRLGGSYAINPLPQFCRNADLKPVNKSRLNGSEGLGRVYSEVYDDHAQIIYLRMGVPAFNSLGNYFSSYYSSDAGQLARTGRSQGFFYALGRVTGWVVSLMSWKTFAVHMLGYGLNLLAKKPSSKFYTSKPEMPLYWNAVQTIVNQIAVNRGVVPRVGTTMSGAGTGDQTTMNDGYVFTQADIQRLHDQFPAMFNESGSIDVYAMATRAQRLHRVQDKNWQSIFNDSDNADLVSNVQRIYGSQISDNGGLGYRQYLDMWLGSEAATPKGASTDSQLSAQINSQAAQASSTGAQNAPASPDAATEDVNQLLTPDNPLTAFTNFLKAEWDDGGAFAGFRVDATGVVTESFSNQAQDSELLGKINGISSNARNVEFDVAGGKLIDSSFINGIVNAAKDTVSGFLDSFNIGGFGQLAGGALAEIPKHWISSSASLNRTTYTISLRSPYGNVFSQLINIYVPFAMILATGLPLSAGPQSYTAPFLVEIYDRGRAISRLAMVENINVSRGVGNTGWTRDGEALGIDVQITFMDLSPILHMPISAGFSLKKAADVVQNTVDAAVVGGAVGGVVGSVAGPGGTIVGAGAGAVAAGVGAFATTAGVFDDESAWSDYLNVLSSIGLADAVYELRRFKRNATQQLTAFTSWKSVSHMASYAGNILPSRVISSLYQGTVRN